MTAWRLPRCLLAPLAALACATFAACDPADPAVDGGADAGGPDAAPPPVAIPWLDRGIPDVTLTPCPAGWREVVDPDGITVCDAYPEAGPSECDYGEAHFPGEAGCRPIGTACPAGDWPADLPADESTVVFVRPGAAGGDGSRATPYGALDQVPWGVRGNGWTIALAKGRHEGIIPLRGGVRVVGACVAETSVTTSSTAAQAVIAVGEPGPMAEVANLAVVDAPIRGIEATDGGSLRITGVLVARTTQVGVLSLDPGSSIEATDLVSTEGQARDDGYYGYGVSVEEGARFSGTRMILTDNKDVALFSQLGGAELSLTDVAISGTEPRVVDGTGGRAIGIQLTSNLVAERLWLHTVRDVAFYVADASATVTDLVITNTLPQEHDGTEGRAIVAQEGGHLEASRVAISDSHDVAIVAAGTMTTMSLTDVVVRDTAEEVGTGRYGRGLNAQDGATLDATRVSISRSHDLGVFVGTGAVATLTDVAVRDTAPAGMVAQSGRGVFVQSVSTVDALRLLVATSRETGIAAVHGTFTGREVVIQDSRPAVCDCPGRASGYGAASVGGTVSLDGFWISGSATCGVLVDDRIGTSGALDLTRGRVEGGAIGACVQVAGYDLDRLTANVAYVDNGTSLDATSLPVPEPIDEL